MEEIRKYADLLSLLDESEQPPTPTETEQGHAAADEDGEVLEWAALLSKANSDVMRKARLRICSAGLMAVQRHLASIPDANL